jgi:hypothetical protein
MSTVDPYEYVKSLDIRDDQSVRTSCPLCGGYNTFTARRANGKVLFNCYKASCDFHGSIQKRRSVESVMQIVNRSNQTLDTLCPFTLPESIKNREDPAFRQYVTSMNIQPAVDASYAHVMYDVAEHRCVFLMYDDNKELIGAVGRALSKGIIPKWKRYDKRKDLMFFCGPKTGTAVLVEDCASACTVFAAGYTGVALLGTNLNEYHVLQLRVFDKVIVALDADASNKSIQMQKMLDLHVKTEILFLQDDLKYFTPCTVKSLIDK